MFELRVHLIERVRSLAEHAARVQSLEGEISQLKKGQASGAQGGEEMQQIKAAMAEQMAAKDAELSAMQEQLAEVQAATSEMESRCGTIVNAFDQFRLSGTESNKKS